MGHQRYLKALSLILLSSIFLSGCNTYRALTETVTKTEIVKSNIPVQERPKQVDLNDIQWYVVTERNMEEFIERFEKENGSVVFYAMSVRDYETLALNMSELKRYILQQKELIIYYEKSVSDEPEPEQEDEL